MKKRIIFFAAFLIVFSAFSQQKALPTVEEIYAKYVKAIGGKEKLNSIETRKKVSSVSIEYVEKKKGKITDQRTRKQDVISFFDYKNRQHALLGKNYPYADRDTIVFVKQITANGKTITMGYNGKKEIKEAVTDAFKGGSFPETAIHPGSEVLPNEMFDGKEVYVVHYEHKIGETEADHYIYFDIDSGLLLGYKDFGANYLLGGSTTKITKIEDYKEVGGVLVPHTIIEEREDAERGMNLTTTTLLKVIAIEFNTDIEDFKNNCFQNPEECFQQYEQALTLSINVQAHTLPTVEDIYANYIEAVGGSKKLKSVESKKEVKSVSTETIFNSRKLKNSRSFLKQETIQNVNYTAQNTTIITKLYLDRLDKTSFSKQLIKDGIDRATKTKVSSSFFDEGPFPNIDIVAQPKSKVLPNEIFNGKESYVVNYEQNETDNIKSTKIYFDVNSRLKIGYKGIYDSKEMNLHTLTTYEDYKEVDGILVPHKTTQKSITTLKTGEFKGTSESTTITEIISLEFNPSASVEDFKKECFLNPEACFEKYINN